MTFEEFWPEYVRRTASFPRELCTVLAHFSDG